MPNKPRYVVALDQGTTSSRAILFDAKANLVGLAQRELTQHYPRPGWVEQDPMEIWASQSATLTEVLAKTGIHSHQLAAIGITNQRETTLVWDRHTGLPIHHAIVWQCRRSAGICEQLKSRGLEPYVRQTTGLLLDAYFSGTKLAWILDEVPGARKKAQRGDLLFGTVDSWLVWKMTEGAVHVTDPTNASRTLLYDIHRQQWDERMLAELDIPAAMLPRVCPSSAIYGHTIRGGGSRIPIAGIAGDQQAALFGQLCLTPGMAKNTYGTGCFLLLHTGTQPVHSERGLLTTIAIGPRGEINYALEGAVFMGGATVQWLRDQLGLLQEASDSAYFAAKVADTQGVYLVPAFVGLGAPYWDPHARGAIVGLTRGSNRNHLIRAALEAIAYQSRDVLEAMQADAGQLLGSLKVDGGAAANDVLMQFQADILGLPVVRPRQIESTAMGAAFLAGLAVGFWPNTEQLQQRLGVERIFTPALDEAARTRLYAGWHKAVQRARHWAE